MKSFAEIIQETKKQIKELTIEEVKSKVDSNKNIILIDVREKSEFEQGYIKDAINISRGLLEQSITNLTIEPTTEIITYCAVGNRSVLAVKTLQEMGYTNCYSMSGGFSEWKAKAFPIFIEKPINMTKEQKIRYSRQMLLKEVGEKGQQKLLNSKVLIVGAGGLGSPVAYYLAAAGVGTIGLIDADTVDLTNLHRQIIHTTARVGTLKTESARESIKQINPEINVVSYNKKLSSDNALDIISNFDVVVDGSDNFQTKYLVNDACFFLNKPNVYGSIFKFDGQVSVFQASNNSPCYRCLFEKPPLAGTVQNCAEAGVLGILPGVIGTLQATEVIKILLDTGEPLIGKLLLYSSLSTSFQTLKIKKNQTCELCGNNPTITKLIDYDYFCSRVE